MVFVFYQFEPAPLHFNPKAVAAAKASSKADEFNALEYKNIQEQRIENLIKFAEVRGYDFVKKPSDIQITEFKDFKAMSKSLLPYGMHSFCLLYTSPSPRDS